MSYERDRAAYEQSCTEELIRMRDPPPPRHVPRGPADAEVVRAFYLRIKQLEKTFRHIHVHSRDGLVAEGDSCLQCGLDLRDPVHAGADPNGT